MSPCSHRLHVPRWQADWVQYTLSVSLGEAPSEGCFLHRRRKACGSGVSSLGRKANEAAVSCGWIAVGPFFLEPWQSDVLWRLTLAVTFEDFFSWALSCPHEVGWSPFLQGPLAERFHGVEIGGSSALIAPTAPSAHGHGLTKPAASPQQGAVQRETLIRLPNLRPSVLNSSRQKQTHHSQIGTGGTDGGLGGSLRCHP